MSDYVPLNDAELEGAVRYADYMAELLTQFEGHEPVLADYVRRLVAEVRERRERQAKIDDDKYYWDDVGDIGTEL